MYFHWGEPGRPGAEHTVNHQQFPAEIQIYGFNTQLYSNLTVARSDMFPGEGGGDKYLNIQHFTSMISPFHDSSGTIINRY